MSNNPKSLHLLMPALLQLDQMHRNISTLARCGIFLPEGVLSVLERRRRHLHLLRQVMVGPTNPMAPSQIKRRGGM
jgi:hypothetical protein